MGVRNLGISLVLESKCKITCLLFESLFFIFRFLNIFTISIYFSKVYSSVFSYSTSNSFGYKEFISCPILFDVIYLNVSTIIFISSLLALGIPARPKASSIPKFLSKLSSWIFTFLLLLPSQLNFSSICFVALHVAFSNLCCS